DADHRDRHRVRQPEGWRPPVRTLRAPAELRRGLCAAVEAVAPATAAARPAHGDRVADRASSGLDRHDARDSARGGTAGFLRDRLHARGGEDRRPADADAERRRAAAAGLRRVPRVPRPARRCAATARGGDAAGADGGALMRQRLFAALLLSGCTLGSHRDAVARFNPEDAARKLEQAETAAQGDPSLLARAGWLRYLIASDPKGALPKLEAAARTGTPAQRALALAGLGEIAEGRTDSSAAARHFIAALQTAPTDPIAELAAVRLLDLEGESPRIDDLIADAAGALRAPVAPRAARLLREAAARISTRRAEAARDPAIEREAWRAVGAVQRWRVGGPFAALRLFDLRRALPLDGRVAAAAAVNDRALEFPDGDVGLELEPADGDIFYAVSEITLERGGEYLLWVEGAAALEARLDGAVAISRVPYPIESPRAQTAAVRLPPGRHQVLVRWSRAEGTRFRLTLARADGDASDLTSAAPRELAGARAAAVCELGEPCITPPAWTDRADLRAAAARPAHRRGAGARLGAFRRCAARPRPGGGGAARGEGAAVAARARSACAPARCAGEFRGCTGASQGSAAGGARPLRHPAAAA